MPSSTSPPRSASTRCCSRWSSPRSPPSCPRSSTRSSGSARARTRWRWATSPARWSSSRRSRRSSRCSSRRARGSSAEGSYVAFASAGIAFLSSAVDLHPDGPARPAARPAACSSAGVFYLAYLVLVDRGRHRRLRLSAAARCPAANPTALHSRRRAAQEPTRMLTEKSDAARRRRPPHHAPTAGVARRPDLLLRGRLRPDARRQGQHHDPRVHVRDRDVRGHPRVLERGAGHALRR